MNFEGLDFGLVEYVLIMYFVLDFVLDVYLNLSLLQNVELDLEGVVLEVFFVQELVYIMEGVYFELYSVVVEVGVFVFVLYFDLYEEMLWVGSYGGYVILFFGLVLECYLFF